MSRALAHIILRPGLISLSEGLVVIREQALRSRAVPGPKAGYIDVVGDSLTFVNWTAEVEEVNGTVTFRDGTQIYSPGFTYAALDGSGRDVIAGGTAQFRAGEWTLDVDTTQTAGQPGTGQFSQARAVTRGLRFTENAVAGQVQLFTPDFQGLFTIQTVQDTVLAESVGGSLRYDLQTAQRPGP